MITRPNRRSVGFTTWKRRSPHIRTLTPTTIACSWRNHAGRSWLAVIILSWLVYPLRNAISPPLHFLNLPNVKEKKLTSQRRQSLHTHIPTCLLPCPHAHKCLGRINQWLHKSCHSKKDNSISMFSWAHIDAPLIPAGFWYHSSGIHQPKFLNIDIPVLTPEQSLEWIGTEWHWNAWLEWMLKIAKYGKFCILTQKIVIKSKKKNSGCSLLVMMLGH